MSVRERFILGEAMFDSFLPSGCFLKTRESLFRFMNNFGSLLTTPQKIFRLCFALHKKFFLYAINLNVYQ